MQGVSGVHLLPISIHALREEGDWQKKQSSTVSSVFQSTPSARRATLAQFICVVCAKFQSTPSARRATAATSPANPPQKISILALREEGDPTGDPAADAAAISIHALREESDCPAGCRRYMRLYFNPRPPRGERLGDTHIVPLLFLFQSTPSARRATETARRR